MADCLIGLGSNVGDRTAAIARALEILGRHSQVAVRAASRNYSTRAVGGPTGQLPFVNAAARLETGLTPPQLLAWLHETEFELGRIRAERWGPRIIDLDLLLFGALVLDEPGLTIPHPRMGYRLFVLVPAVEIAAEMLHPGIGWSLGRLVEHLRSSREYLAVTGVAGVGKTKLVTRLQSVSDCRTVTADLEEADLERLRADPDGSALQMELEFLRLRADRLAAGFAADTGGRQSSATSGWVKGWSTPAAVWTASR